tara:strand:+ start:74 stop:379 length:306 start_codon:yes stop_codon:yes gene_type:complete
MPIYMTAQYQVQPQTVEQTKKNIRELVKHVKLHEPLTSIYIAQQEILNQSKFMHILKFEDETALATHQNSPASAHFVKAVYPKTLRPVEFMEYNLIATVNQ